MINLYLKIHGSEIPVKCISEPITDHCSDSKDFCVVVMCVETKEVSVITIDSVEKVLTDIEVEQI